MVMGRLSTGLGRTLSGLPRDCETTFVGRHFSSVACGRVTTSRGVSMGAIRCHVSRTLGLLEVDLTSCLPLLIFLLRVWSQPDPYYQGYYSEGLPGLDEFLGLSRANEQSILRVRISQRVRGRFRQLTILLHQHPFQELKCRARSLAIRRQITSLSCRSVVGTAFLIGDGTYPSDPLSVLIGLEVFRSNINPF